MIQGLMVVYAGVPVSDQQLSPVCLTHVQSSLGSPIGTPVRRHGPLNATLKRNVAA
jgi:hypothetical protein